MCHEPQAPEASLPEPKMQRLSRRQFLASTGLAAGAAVSGLAFASGSRAPTILRKSQPNFMLIITDQQGLDTLSGLGCPKIHTPNMDRLMKRGVTFLQSHSTNPVCSPARSSLMTGHMPVETGVISNNRPIHETVPNMGQWFSRAGYETVYAGKWHLPGGYPLEIPGFTVLPSGGGQGDLVDVVVSRSCEAYLKTRDSAKPFLLVASLLQPHDICYWAIRDQMLVPELLPFPQLAEDLPDLPPNLNSRPLAPKKLDERVYTRFNETQWRYYLYIYHRQVEMVDRDIGRILEALKDSGEADNTLVVLTADHGDGRGRHSHVSKWYPYDESVKVPLLVSCPGRIAEDVKDANHLVSGLDVMSTFCDYAGIERSAGAWSRSLRPLLEDLPVDWRDFLVVENHFIGRSVRTDRFKYVHYEDDPVEQLFDMKEDPWETVNLIEEARTSDVLADHRKLLDSWNARLKVVEPTPESGKGWRPPKRTA